MAKADVKMPDEFLAKLSRLGSQTDTIAGKVLQAGGEVALDKVRSNLKAVVGSGTKSECGLQCASNYRHMCPASPKRRRHRCEAYPKARR